MTGAGALPAPRAVSVWMGPAGFGLFHLSVGSEELNTVTFLSGQKSRLLTALSNGPLDAACYIFTVSWVWPMTLLVCLPLGKQAGRLKMPLCRVTNCGNGLRLLTELCRSLPWTPPAGLPSVMRLTAMPAMPRRPLSIAARTYHPSRHGHTPTFTVRTSKGLCFYAACDSCPKSTWLSRAERGPRLLKADWPPRNLDPSVLRLWRGGGGHCSAADTLSGYGVAVPAVQPILATASWPLKLIWVMFSAFRVLYSLVTVCLLL